MADNITILIVVLIFRWLKLSYDGEQFARKHNRNSITRKNVNQKDNMTF